MVAHTFSFGFGGKTGSVPRLCWNYNKLLIISLLYSLRFLIRGSTGG